ncbi:tRNA (N6-threonylcarbamoyladenosine(37)-N6)-methyltransferase TrmO [Desulfonatronum thiodismutans]|uniref:tRNA (N6-threonylcarbamoyladenosine(37)-N6)-methyltransferase TrmO n=1 Tax=Desulfonatronum thiodismutans TaxID=159290 RepID=UPI0004ABE32B|nr:tRNA (N6-threonylcarbamoyladenosine(37)-N6)-methyltransferase TrmO [Desulfonatronum thiodismutans]
MDLNLTLTLAPVGVVRSSLKRLEDCPKQGRENGPTARIEVDAAFRGALDGLAPGAEILVFTWMHLAERDRLTARARGNPDNPLQGVFALRSPHRPNPIGLHQVRIVGLDAKQGNLDVFPLEAVEGTPVVDIKPVLAKGRGEGTPYGLPWGPRISAREAGMIRETGNRAWQRGLMAGLNGNISLRQGDAMIITVSGSAKGRLRPGDLALVDLASGAATGPGRPSTEAALHRAVYASQSKAQAILHVHPPHLLALSLAKPGGDLLESTLFEADVWSRKMIRLPALQPGCEALAKQVGRAAMAYPALFMERHGLVCWGRDLDEALALAEELESLARIDVLHRSMMDGS